MPVWGFELLDAGLCRGCQHPEKPGITVEKDRPYHVRGLQLVAGDGEAYDSRERQALCRCGGSRNKPFCDGTHWYMGFKHQMGDAPSVLFQKYLVHNAMDGYIGVHGYDNQEGAAATG